MGKSCQKGGRQDTGVAPGGRDDALARAPMRPLNGAPPMASAGVQEAGVAPLRSSKFGRLALAIVGFAPALVAQGGADHLNFETPPHHALAVVSVGSRDFLLVANTPDASVEIWDARALTFQARVAVGQEPVTVVARPEAAADGSRRCYVANWLGDSITSFDLALDPRRPSQPPLVTLRRTVPVGDEPTGIAFLPELATWPDSLPGGSAWRALVVTFGAAQRMGLFDRESLQPLLMLPGSSGAPEGHSGAIELLDPTRTQGVKQPLAIAFAPKTANAPNVADRLWILNGRGGSVPSIVPGEEYDFDLFASDDLVRTLHRGAATRPPIGGLGTSHFDFDFARNGDLWVAGQTALHKQLNDFVNDQGEAVMAAKSANGTGFVKSQLFRVRGNGSVERIDLNDDAGAMATQPVVQPVAVRVYGRGGPGTRVFAAGLGSDSMGIVLPGSGGPNAWQVHRVRIGDPTRQFYAGRLDGLWRGPCALALLESGVPNDPSDRLFVLNLGTRSITVCDPNYPLAQPSTFVVGHFPLAADPTARHVQLGRPFLYSSELSAGRNTSCASCHLFGRSDFLAWNLAGNHALPDEGDPNHLPFALGPNAATKGPMQTQSLVGLVNFELPGNDFTQDFAFSNRPYHWRGDKGLFEDFNAAFVNLMGMAEISGNTSGNGDFNKGLPDAAMTKFRRFAFSMHYPPNPQEPLTRTLQGSAYSTPQPPDDPIKRAREANDPSVGTGAARGQKLFHILPSDRDVDLDGDGTFDAALSCVHCHSLPEGSNNRLTLGRFHAFAPLAEQMLETPQLRGLASKEKRRHWIDRDSGELRGAPDRATAARTGEFGLTHTGHSSAQTAPNLPPLFANGSWSIADFISLFVRGGLFPVDTSQAEDLERYVRQLDTGVAPIVGRGATFDVATRAIAPKLLAVELAMHESQALAANSGLAVHARLQGAWHGLWFDVAAPRPSYRELAQAGLAPLADLDGAALLTLLDPADPRFAPDNLLFVQSTPLGAERRLAWLGAGSPPVTRATRPTRARLEGCVPMSANAEIPRMIDNWEDLAQLQVAFLDGPPLAPLRPDASTIVLGVSLVRWAKTATPSGFGLTRLRHEAPRRFSVSGEGITAGAVLRLWAPTIVDIATASKSTPPTTAPLRDPKQNSGYFELPLFASRRGGGSAWESAAEIEPMLLYALLNGGVANDRVRAALEDPWDPRLQSLSSFDVIEPQRWNWWWVQVVNDPAHAAATTLDAGWQRLTLAD